MPVWARSSTALISLIVRQMWHMIVRRSSPPSLRTNSAICIGMSGWRPGWIMSGAPVSRWVMIAARKTFRSFSVHG